ncbi:PH domain-containing protein [Chryseobacterium sp. FH1]|uniref:PH domain-containing protein n=1 Tax=Chryseobacterium sp. FH1 TaxID=1233951 RepID=UPI0004E2A4C3|nr:PH domain-containing protein [Chryseobacterium sp. FH1]KFC18784.1 hypothetical protein IO90_17495 [Chryseobacterium sp. FH1]
MKSIPVKIGWKILLFVLAVLILTNYQELINKNWKAIAIVTSIFGLILGLCFSIKYYLDEEFLYIKNSVFGTTKIDVRDIYKIEKTWNLLSSPAPSIIGRVEIYYQNESVVISPKSFENFKNEVLKINPNITVKA